MKKDFNAEKDENYKIVKVEKVELKDFDETEAYPLELSDGADIRVGDDRARRSLAPNPVKGTYDPFDKFKTEPDKYYYYAVNANAKLLREERVRQGFELIPEAVNGDLILGRMPIEKHKEMMKKEDDKAKEQLRAPKEAYKEEMRQMGAGRLVEE